MTVFSGWNSREVSLNGRLIGVTVSTPPRPPSRPMSSGRRAPISPITAMTVRSLPTWSYGVRPSPRMALFTPRISASLAVRAITTNIFVRFLSGQTKKQRSRPLLQPGTTRDPGPRLRGRSCRASKVEVFVHPSSGRYGPPLAVSTRRAARSADPRPAGDPLDDLALRVGVVLNVFPLLLDQLALRG